MNQIHMKVLEQLRAMLTGAKTFLLQIVQKNGRRSNSSSSSQLVFLL
jgi:DNA-binding transcriptional regulator YiaG